MEKTNTLATPKTSLTEIIDSSRLLLFSGKGGVGKTTFAASAAIELASTRQDLHVYLLSLDSSHSLSDMLKDEFDRRPVNENDQRDGLRISQAFCTRAKRLKGIANLDIIELDFAKLTKDFQDDYGTAIEGLVEQGTLLNDSDIAAFLDVSLPAMGELMALMEMAEILDSDSAARVFVDAAPTGHTLRLLQLPDFLRYLANILDLVDQRHQLVVSSMVGGTQPLSADELTLDKMESRSASLKRHLEDTQRSGSIIIALAERMVLAETVDMLNELEQKMVAVKAFIVNKVTQPGCSFCQDRLTLQRTYLEELVSAAGQLPVYVAPLMPSEPRSAPALTSLWHALQPPPAIFTPEASSKTEKIAKFKIEGRLSDYVDKRLELLIFAGKGGVGKTSLAASSGLVLAERHREKRILLASIDPAHSLGDSLGQALTTEPKQVEDNLFAAEVDAKFLLSEFKETYQSEVGDFVSSLLPGGSDGQASISCNTDKEIIDKLLDLETPDLDEFMVFRWLTRMRHQAHFDLIILDPAPAGHLLRFLQLPQIAKKWIKAFLSVINKHRAIEKTQNTVRELLSIIKAIGEFENEIKDPAKTALIAVGTPQEVVIAGMLSMLEQLKEQDVPLDAIVINMLRDNQTDCTFCHHLHEEQLAMVGSLKERAGQIPMARHEENAQSGTPIKFVLIPQANTEIQGKATLTLLGREMYGYGYG
ncbi:MAG TPA: ArsA family ATPase [Oculatellaceae cyanobacterium]